MDSRQDLVTYLKQGAATEFANHDVYYRSEKVLTRATLLIELPRCEDVGRPHSSSGRVTVETAYIVTGDLAL